MTRAWPSCSSRAADNAESHGCISWGARLVSGSSRNASAARFAAPRTVSLEEDAPEPGGEVLPVAIEPRRLCRRRGVEATRGRGEQPHVREPVPERDRAAVVVSRLDLGQKRALAAERKPRAKAASRLVAIEADLAVRQLVERPPFDGEQLAVDGRDTPLPVVAELQLVPIFLRIQLDVELEALQGVIHPARERPRGERARDVRAANGHVLEAAERLPEARLAGAVAPDEEDLPRELQPELDEAVVVVDADASEHGEPERDAITIRRGRHGLARPWAGDRCAVAGSRRQGSPTTVRLHWASQSSPETWRTSMFSHRLSSSPPMP